MDNTQRPQLRTRSLDLSAMVTLHRLVVPPEEVSDPKGMTIANATSTIVEHGNRHDARPQSKAQPKDSLQNAPTVDLR
jgi:hypothetical protein